MSKLVTNDNLKAYHAELAEHINLLQRNTAYVLNDIVNYDGITLKCTTAGTTNATKPNISSLSVGSTYTDGTCVWTRVDLDKRGIDYYVASKDYGVDDQVVYDNKIYKCSTAHTSTSTFDATKWTEIGAGGGGGISEWASGTSYSSGDLAIKDNVLYKANTTTSTTWVDSEWDIIGTTFNTTSTYAQKIVTNVIAPYEMLMQVGDSNYCKPPIDVLKKTGGSDNVTLTLENYNNASAYTGTSDFLKIENSKAKLYNYKEYPITPQTLSTIDIGVSDEIDFNEFVGSGDGGIDDNTLAVLHFDESETKDECNNISWTTTGALQEYDLTSVTTSSPTVTIEPGITATVSEVNLGSFNNIFDSSLTSYTDITNNDVEINIAFSSPVNVDLVNIYGGQQLNARYMVEYTDSNNNIVQTDYQHLYPEGTTSGNATYYSDYAWYKIPINKEVSNIRLIFNFTKDSYSFSRVHQIKLTKLITNSALSSDIAKFGNSVYLSSAYMVSANITPTYPIEIDFWAYLTSESQRWAWLFSWGAYTNSGNSYLGISTEDSYFTVNLGTTDYSMSKNINRNVWTHFCMNYDGEKLLCFIDGVKYLEQTISASSLSWSSFTDLFALGNFGYAPNNRFNGYIDELRISNIIRHTENFTPPTQPYTRPNYNITSLEVE